MWPYRLPQWGPLLIGVFAALLICADAALFLLAFVGFWIVRANPALSFLFPRIQEVETSHALEMSAVGSLIVLSGAMFASLCFYLGLTDPFEIVVDPSDAAIRVRSIIRIVRVPAADIHRITIGGFLDFSLSRLVVRHSGGKIACFNRFRDGDRLIDDIQALNPSIEIERIRGFRGL